MADPEDATGEPWRCILCDRLVYNVDVDPVNGQTPKAGAPAPHTIVIQRPGAAPNEYIKPVCRTCHDIDSAVYDSGARAYFRKLEDDAWWKVNKSNG